MKRCDLPTELEGCTIISISITTDEIARLNEVDQSLRLRTSKDSCCKKEHLGEKTAELRARMMSDAKGEAIRPYPCDRGAHWHVTGDAPQGWW